MLRCHRGISERLRLPSDAVQDKTMDLWRKVVSCCWIEERKDHAVKLFNGSFQFSSVQSLDPLGRQGDLRDNLAKILFQNSLLEAPVSSSGMGRDVHSLMLFTQHFLCRPRPRPSSEVPWNMGLKRLSWRVTCPNYASFFLLTVVRRGSCGPTMKWILLRIQSLVLCSEWEMRREALGFESLDPFFKVRKQGPCFTAIEEDGGDKRLVEFELACKTNGVALPDPV